MTVRNDELAQILRNPHLRVTCQMPGVVEAWANIKHVRQTIKCQRILDKKRAEAIADKFIFPALGRITVCLGKNYYPDEVEYDNNTLISVDGQTRLYATSLVYGPRLTYTRKHEKEGLIPEGFKVGQPVHLPVRVVYGMHPVEVFLIMNACRAVKSVDKFRTMTETSDENMFSNEKGLRAAFEERGIQLEFFGRRNVRAVNKTWDAQALLPEWEKDSESVRTMIDLIVNIYTGPTPSGNAIEYAALKSVFMLSMLDVVKGGFEPYVIRQALTAAKVDGNTAENIMKDQNTMGTGGWVRIHKITETLRCLIRRYRTKG